MGRYGGAYIPPPKEPEESSRMTTPTATYRCRNCGLKTDERPRTLGHKEPLSVAEFGATYDHVPLPTTEHIPEYYFPSVPIHIFHRCSENMIGACELLCVQFEPEDKS